MMVVLFGCSKEENTVVKDYEVSQYNTELYTEPFLSEGLCVAKDDVQIDGFAGDTSLHGAALFDIDHEKVLYAYDMHDRLYPASTTKIMTALLALEYGDLKEEVVISENADASAFPVGAQLCGLRKGQVWTLEDLVNALMLYSGNDAGTAIAEHIAGSEEAFVDMMNQKAKEICATNTHFMNPHGLHEDAHYTTAYDLYLIFNECIKDERFVEIIQSPSYEAVYKNADGTEATAEFKPTNLYAKGTVDQPGNVTIIGGKTGTTGEAGRCLILMEKDEAGHKYISVVMGASDKEVLYRDMTALIRAIPAN